MSKKALTALIVDRNPGARKTLTSMLRQTLEVTEVIQATSANEALKLLKTAKQINWVFTETSLPDLEWFIFIDEAKKISSAKAASFIIVSSQTNREVLIKAASMGVKDFIKKPYTTATLVTKLRKIAGGSEQRSNRRVDLLGAYNAKIGFCGNETDSKLMDISLGGCQVSCTGFSDIKAGVYDVVEIHLKTEYGIITVKGEIVRLERNRLDGEKAINAAFEFVEVSQ
ncbi:MAG: response regulator, partial [Gammaproteobacteria bacterium]|nr:response regulator [Gammaproteobacteria bacterium]